MPAVHIAQLEQESRAIAALFKDAKKLVRALDLHFEKYALRSKRQGQVRRTPTVLIDYELPHPVGKQLRKELFPHIQSQPKEGLILIDGLWQRRTLAHRELAIYLLGRLPANHFRNVSARLQKWSEENREARLITKMAKDGCHQMRAGDPKALLAICRKLFKKRAIRIRATGLMIIKYMMDELSLEQLPAMLNLIIPLAQNPAKGLRPYLIQVMDTLIAISPGEALYFIQQRLSEDNKEGTLWLARQSLRFFPEFEANLLKESIPGKSSR